MCDMERDWDSSRINKELQQTLSPYYISRRDNGRDTSYYLTTNAVEQLANEIFGLGKWRKERISTTVEDVATKDGVYTVLSSTVMRVTLSDGTFREDVGYATAKSSDKDEALEQSAAFAAAGALRRAMRLFGNALGNCIEPEYTRFIEENLSSEFQVPL